ncbi:hypothetical protein FOA52_014106 [Chlamydomonas sp. UWO 241]|nr:hypothetical protein FOA52_014106 [Chlamydomonas sp. UWO 241]
MPASGHYFFATFCAVSVAWGASVVIWLVSSLQTLMDTQGVARDEARIMLYGVDVTNSRFFSDPTVLRAVELAAEAHKGQTRKTGEPYVSHCIETALIVEHNIPPNVEYKRYTSTIVAAVLHDVIDDTSVGLGVIRDAFGDSVAGMVANVSRLSSMNQLLRRGKRKGWAQYTPEHFRMLRKMIVDLSFEEPLVILIKLADRLHNMRSVYVLKAEKQRSVSEETLEVWCTMANSLGWDAVKAELEDLCFAVLQPHTYSRLRYDVDALWGLPTPRGIIEMGLAGDDEEPGVSGSDSSGGGSGGGGAGGAPAARELAGALGVSSGSAGGGGGGSGGGGGVALLPLRAAAVARAMSRALQPDKDGSVNVRAETVDAYVREFQRASERLSSHGMAGPGPGSASAAAAKTWPKGRQPGKGGVLAASASASASASAVATVVLTASREEDVVGGGRVQQQGQQQVSPWSPLFSHIPGRALQQQQQVPQQQQQQQQLQQAQQAQQAQQQQQQQPMRPVLPDTAAAAPGSLLILTPQQAQLRELLSTVVPFDSIRLKSTKGYSTQRGLEVLGDCAQLLYSEITLRSVATGLHIQIQGRLKSLSSVHVKMARKQCSVAQVYDARALRVIVDDEGGTRVQDAVETCYKLVSAVHSLWKSIPREFDDYISNPKPSGYQALHTAVRGPRGIPMEVQIKTSSMHELAEYGAAAHWVYKEYVPVVPRPKSARRKVPRPPPPPPQLPLAASAPSASALASAPESAVSAVGSGSSSSPLSASTSASLPAPSALASTIEGVAGYIGQPVLRISKDRLRYGVVVQREGGTGKRLVVAIKLGSTFAGFPTRVPHYSFYWSLLTYTLSKGWVVPGHGDLNLCLEEYVMARDGRYHRCDHMGYLQAGETITLLEGYEEDAEVAHAGEQPLDALATQVSLDDETSSDSDGGVGGALDPALERSQRKMQEAFLRTQQLRSIIEWGAEAIGKYSAAGLAAAGGTGESVPEIKAALSEEVSILVWPDCKIEYFPRGTNAGDVIRQRGLISVATQERLVVPPEGMFSTSDLLVNVNNRLVPETTLLNDGDLVILARDKLKI